MSGWSRFDGSKIIKLESAQDWARLVLDVPDMRRRFEGMLDARTNCTADEKRRVMLSLKRMAGMDDADDMAPLVEALRALMDEMGVEQQEKAMSAHDYYSGRGGPPPAEPSQPRRPLRRKYTVYDPNFDLATARGREHLLDNFERGLDVPGSQSEMQMQYWAQVLENELADDPRAQDLLERWRTRS